MIPLWAFLTFCGGFAMLGVVVTYFTVKDLRRKNRSKFQGWAAEPHQTSSHHPTVELAHSFTTSTDRPSMVLRWLFVTGVAAVFAFGVILPIAGILIGAWFLGW